MKQQLKLLANAAKEILILRALSIEELQQLEDIGNSWQQVYMASSTIR